MTLDVFFQQHLFSRKHSGEDSAPELNIQVSGPAEAPTEALVD